MRMKKKKHGPERRALLSALTTENIAELYENKEKIYGNNNPLRIEIGCGKGDFVCGSVAIKMCVGDTAMGGACSFDGQRLVVSVEDFHVSIKDPSHSYRLDVLTDGGVVYSQSISCTEPTRLALDTEDVAFYRVEVLDETAGLRLAIGNPIWNNK